MPKAPNSSTDIIEIVDDNLRDGFAQVPRLVMKAQGLSLKAKAVYMLLLDYAWQKGSCFPGHPTLAEDLDVSIDTVQRALQELRKWKLIDWKRQGLNRPNVYSILRVGDNPFLVNDRTGNRKLRFQEAAGLRHQEAAKTGYEEYPTKNTQRKNTSSIRKASPKNEETSEEGQGSQPPLEAPLTESTDNPPKLPQPEKPREAGREGELSPARSEPKISSQVLPPGLTRQYLSAARSKAQHPGDLQGLVSLASVLPQPPTTKRTYSQERQVLVDVIADLAREFRDEATLTESVSRAYNLMGKARITDIGVFTAKIYEARSITKERYGSIKRGRMPYFFSVLEDVCGQRRKPAFKPDAAS